MKKANIAVLVISLFFAVIFGAFVISYQFNFSLPTTVPSAEDPTVMVEVWESQQLGEFILDKIPTVKNYKWIAILASQILLVIFTFFAGYSIFGKFSKDKVTNTYARIKKESSMKEKKEKVKKVKPVKVKKEKVKKIKKSKAAETPQVSQPSEHKAGPKVRF